MILEKIDEVVKNEQIKLDNVRFKTLHVSEMAICGYKYRYALDNNLKIPHKWLFEIGNAFEFIMVRKLKQIYPNGQTQYVLNGTELIEDDEENNRTLMGHCDFVDVESSTVIEIKSSKSNNFNDIYYRQLFAYMIIGRFKNGILLKYNLLEDKMYEINFTIEDAVKNVENFYLNLNAFYSNTYVEGIENSICKFCENTNCKMSGKKV